MALTASVGAQTGVPDRLACTLTAPPLKECPVPGQPLAYEQLLSDLSKGDHRQERDGRGNNFMHPRYVYEARPKEATDSHQTEGGGRGGRRGRGGRGGRRVYDTRTGWDKDSSRRRRHGSTQGHGPHH